MNTDFRAEGNFCADLGRGATADVEGVTGADTGGFTGVLDALTASGCVGGFTGAEPRDDTL
jgi:hypothetical protein